MKLLYTLFLLAQVSQAAPQVAFAKGTISTILDAAHPPIHERLEVLEQDNCTVQKELKRLVLNTNCGFVRGLYRYSFKEGSQEPRILFVEFTAFRTAQGYGFISAAPVELASQ